MKQTWFKMIAIVALVLPGASRAQSNPAATAAPAPGPALGSVAPDVAMSWTDQTGKVTTGKLSDFRGKVVVLAFYPADRTSGCTAEMHKFRDEYATLFPNGVVVLPISHDNLASHTAWAKDDNFPFSMVSDTAGAIAAQFASANARTPSGSFQRTVYVIGKDGKIVYKELRFGPVDQNAYDAMTAAIKSARSR